MLKPWDTKQFKRDLKRIKRQGMSLIRLREVVTKIVNEKPLSAKFKDHPLKGKWASSRDCHIHGDLILIYTINK